MKLSYIFWFLLSVLLFNACKSDDEEGSLTLHFAAQYDGQPLAMFTTKPGLGAEQLQFTHLSFFSSDAFLLKNGDDFKLFDQELVDMSFDDENDAEEGYTVQIDHVP